MTISDKVWTRYLKALRRMSDEAAAALTRWMAAHDFSTYEGKQALIRYAYALATKYGEGAGALACQMYDALAELSGVILPPAVPAATATMQETARAVIGTLNQDPGGAITADAVGRLARLAGVDTTMQNAIRDGAEWAWIPSGDTCAFCITLASRGWQTASRAALKGNHAEHVHANCDCTYAVRFDRYSGVAGYDPDRYKEMYDDSPGRSSQDKINAMRRKFYAENREEINEQKRSNYEKRKELESSAAEEHQI